MKLGAFLLVKAVVSLGFGIAFAALPAPAMSLFGVTLDASGALMARFVGACLIGIGLICWLERSTQPARLSNVILALFAADTIGFVIALLGQLSGAMNVLG